MSPAKIKDTWGSWRNKPYASRSDETQRRAALWQAFCDYVRENGPAWIISPPGSRVAILETEKGSALPARLAGLGYEVTEIASGERLTGGGLSLAEEKLKRKGYAIEAAGPTMQVSRFEVLLPWAAAPVRR